MAWEADELTASFQTVAGEPTRAPLVMPHAYPRVPPHPPAVVPFLCTCAGLHPSPSPGGQRPRVHL